MCCNGGGEDGRRERVQALATTLYTERYDYLLRIARANAATEADAEEAVQEAFASFLRAFDPDDEAPPLAWVTLTLKRACWAAYRRQHLDRCASQEAAPGSGESGCSGESIRATAAGPERWVVQVDDARGQLAQLKPAERRAIGLIAAGYSYAEVGQITGWTQRKINRCASEGRARLRAGG